MTNTYYGYDQWNLIENIYSDIFNTGEPFSVHGQRRYGKKLALTSTAGLVIGAGSLYAILNQELIISWIIGHQEFSGIISGILIAAALISFALYLRNKYKENDISDESDEDTDLALNSPPEPYGPKIALALGFFTASGVGAAGLYSILNPQLVLEWIKTNPVIAGGIVAAFLVLTIGTLYLVNKENSPEEIADFYRNNEANFG